MLGKKASPFIPMKTKSKAYGAFSNLIARDRASLFDGTYVATEKMGLHIGKCFLI